MSPIRKTSDSLALTAQPFDDWHVVEAAVSNWSRETQFAAGRHSESRMALPGEDAIMVPVIDLYELSAADLIKIDIEGSEWPILGTDASRVSMRT